MLAPVTDRPGERSGVERGAVFGLAAWLVAVAISMLWPTISPLDTAAGITAPPFYGEWSWHAPGGLVPAAAFGVILVAYGPRAIDRLSWRLVPIATGVSSATWATALAASEGTRRIGQPLVGRHQYLPFATTIQPGDFVSTFVPRAESYPTHVKGHPPGATLVVWLIDRLGLGTPVSAAVVMLAVWGLGIGAVTWTVAEVADRATARRVAPYLVVIPAVVWAGTSIDALFAGVSAAAIACMIAATRRSEARRRIALAVAGGLLFGLALHLSYGAAPLLAIPLLVAHRRRRDGTLIVAGAGAVTGAAIATAAFVAGGFWWFDGLDATRGFYADGLARVRPYGYFVFAGNLGALAIAIGPAVAAGLATMARAARRHPELVLCVGAATAVLAANLSGLSKGEVERIWLPFVPWLVVGSAALPRRDRTWWLGGQLAITLAVQAWLVTPW